MFFLMRYSRMLESGHYRNRTADFVYMLLFGGVTMIVLNPLLHIQLLGIPPYLYARLPLEP